MATSASIYNQQRTNRQVLKRHRKDQPSLVIHLNNGHFRFERQSGIFAFDSPARAFLDCIRQQRVPVDLLDVLVQSNVAFYEGCLIIEVHDHRPPNLGSTSNDPLPASTLQRISTGTSTSLLDRSKQPLYGNSAARRRAQAEAQGSSISTGPEVYRIVLHATGETLWQDIKDLDASLGPSGQPVWNDEDALRVEAKVLALTSPPLCLTPDPHASKIANIMLAATAPSIAYNPPANLTTPFHRNRDARGVKRGPMNSVEAEEQAFKRRRRDLILRLMEKGTAGQTEPTRPLPGVVSSGGIAATALAAQRANGEEANVSAPAGASSIFAPTFGRLGFIEHFRDAKARNDKAGVPRPGGIGFGGANVGIAGGAGGAGTSQAPAGAADAAAAAAAADSAPLAAASAAEKAAKPKKPSKKKQKQDDADASTTAGSPPAAEEPPAKPKKMSKKARLAEEKAIKAAAEKAAAEKAEKERKEAEAAKGKGKKKAPAKKKAAAKGGASSPAADAEEAAPATPASESMSLAQESGKGKKKPAPKKSAAKGSATKAGAQQAPGESPSSAKGRGKAAQQQQQQQQQQPQQQPVQMNQLPPQMQQLLQGLPMPMQMQPHQLQMQLQQAAQAQVQAQQAAQIQAATGVPDLSALGMNGLGLPPGMGGGRMNNMPVQGNAGAANLANLPLQQQQQLFLAAQQQMQQQAAAGMKPPGHQGGMHQQLGQHMGMQGMPMMGGASGLNANQMQNALQMALQQQQQQQQQQQPQAQLGQQMQLDPNLAAQYNQLMAQLAWNQQQQQQR